MNLRNATFTKCKFNHVTFNRLPEISIKEKEEGYQIAYGGIKMPIMTQDQHNVYNHICVGWTKPIGDKVYIYDKDTHALYKKYFNNESYNICNVHRNYWSGHEISHVDFVDSCMENTTINEIKFLHGSFDGVIVDNVTFNDVEFDDYIIKNTIFNHCKFNKVTFYKNSLTGNQFNQCSFDNGYFWECRISKSNQFNHANGKKIVFQLTKMDRNILTLFDKTEVKLSFCQDFSGKLIYE